MHRRETSNALNAPVRCEQKRLQRLSETVPANNRIPRAVRQGIPDRRTSHTESPSAIGAELVTRHDQKPLGSGAKMLPWCDTCDWLAQFHEVLRRLTVQTVEHQMNVLSVSASISVIITDIWTKFGTDLKFHSVYTPGWSNSQPQNTRCRLPPSWMFRLCEIKKMSVAPDWMKIYASNFTE